MNEPNQGEPLETSDPASGETPVARKLGDLHKTITMAQIAKAAGVSQGAISSLLNDRDYGIRVSERTRERVFKVCREMGYIPNDLRAVVRMYPEFGDFCLLVCAQQTNALADPFISRVTAAAIAATPPALKSITFSFYDEQFDYVADPEQLPHPVREGVASKFICFGAPNMSLIQTLLKRGSPVVCLGYEVPQPGVLSLLADYQMAARLAVEHLFKLGHKHIAIISGPFGTTDPRVLELNRGVRIAYEQFGFPIAAQNIIYADLTHQAGAAAFDSLGEQKPEPTAVFCMSDSVAAGVIAAAHLRGCKVPEELSVIGCSDDTLAQFTCPSLTTIHVPAEEMAAHAVREIDRMVRNPSLADPKREVLGVRLVERESCGPPRAR